MKDDDKCVIQESWMLDDGLMVFWGKDFGVTTNLEEAMVLTRHDVINKIMDTHGTVAWSLEYLTSLAKPHTLVVRQEDILTDPPGRLPEGIADPGETPAEPINSLGAASDFWAEVAASVDPRIDWDRWRLAATHVTNCAAAREAVSAMALESIQGPESEA